MKEFIPRREVQIDNCSYVLFEISSGQVKAINQIYKIIEDNTQLDTNKLVSLIKRAGCKIKNERKHFIIEDSWARISHNRHKQKRVYLKTLQKVVENIELQFRCFY